MSLRHAAEKRPVLPDAKYGDSILGKFMNCVMYAGRKTTAESIVYGGFDLIEKRGGKMRAEFFIKLLRM